MASARVTNPLSLSCWMECSGWASLWRFVHALNSLEFNFVMSGWKKHPFAIFCGLERASFFPSFFPFFLPLVHSGRERTQEQNSSNDW